MERSENLHITMRRNGAPGVPAEWAYRPIGLRRLIRLSGATLYVSRRSFKIGFAAPRFKYFSTLRHTQTWLIDMASVGSFDRPIKSRIVEEEESTEYRSTDSEKDSVHSSNIDFASDYESSVESSDDEADEVELKPDEGAGNSQDGGFKDSDLGESSGDEPEQLKDISFGALAKAQALLATTSRKRKADELSRDQSNPRPITQDPEDKAEKYTPSSKTTKASIQGRSSKHAPAVQSSRHAVSRRRDVFDPPSSLKSRDPRFDPTVTGTSIDSSKANKAYSFLSTYQASEILALKSQIAKSKDPDTIANLKRQIMSLDSKLKSADARQREQDILARHKKEEREKIASGQKAKPYFLKRSEVKKEILKERFEGMSKKARDKAVERKRKRVKGKESKGMPWVRRETAE